VFVSLNGVRTPKTASVIARFLGRALQSSLRTGFEVHGTEGSIIARNVMTQRPVGEILLRDASGDARVSFADHNLYERSMGLFMAAVDRRGQPSATGVDGVKSLAVAAAVKRAATSGRRVAVEYGGL